jgi:hypothetical protein
MNKLYLLMDLKLILKQLERMEKIQMNSEMQNQKTSLLINAQFQTQFQLISVKNRQRNYSLGNGSSEKNLLMSFPKIFLKSFKKMKNQQPIVC